MCKRFWTIFSLGTPERSFCWTVHGRRIYKTFQLVNILPCTGRLHFIYLLTQIFYCLGNLGSKWNRSFVCSVPYTLNICKAEGYLVLLQNMHANVAIFMLTKENRKVCNKTKTPPTSLLGHRGLSWLLPFFIDPGLKGLYWFFYFSPCERERSAKGWKQFTKQWGREKSFRHFEACSLSHWEKSWKNSGTTSD